MSRWPEYQSVAARKQRSKKEQERLKKDGHQLQPVEVTGRKIANTFWGQAWCDHLESFSDYSNRLARGRSYVRNGAVCDLKITAGKIEAKVSGSDLYCIRIDIDPLPEDTWHDIKEACAGGIASVLELLQGKLSSNVMNVVTDQHTGLFPDPSEIELGCDCPDYASLCKHLSAVLYGVGARLDESPELLFTLRGVDHKELIDSGNLLAVPQAGEVAVRGNLADIFGIELDDAPLVMPESTGNTKTDEKVTKKAKSKNKESTGTAAKTKVKSKSKKQQRVKSEVKTRSKPAAPGAKASKASAGKKAKLKPAKKAIKIIRGIRASHLKELRKQHGLNAAQLARVIGVSVQTINRWESTRGVLNIRGTSQVALEEVLKLTGRQIVNRLKK